MAEEIQKGIISTNQAKNKLSALRDVFLGICLFLAVNFVLMLAESAIISFFWTKDATFFTNRSSYKIIVELVTFSAIFLINVAISI
jgi:hypothetical protein